MRAARSPAAIMGRTRRAFHTDFALVNSCICAYEIKRGRRVLMVDQEMPQADVAHMQAGFLSAACTHFPLPPLRYVI